MYRRRRCANGTFAASYYKRMLFKWTSCCACIYPRTRDRTHVGAHPRSQTVLANARKCITAIDAWAISACKRDCVLCVGSKTFRMYYIYTNNTNSCGVSANPTLYLCCKLHMCTCISMKDGAVTYVHICNILLLQLRS